jgi:hypothetical protein
VEDDIAEDNPARAIGVDVDLLVDVGELGFKHGAGAGGAGQPASDPADLLARSFHGSLNRVHSSRRLAAACLGNLELRGLLKGLRPGDHMIADFRNDNAKAVNRAFMLPCRAPGLYGGTRVGRDGSVFNGNAGAGRPRPRTVSCASVTAATSATAGRARSATPVRPRRPRAGTSTAPSMPMPWIATARGWLPPPRRCANALRCANIRSGR